MQMTWEGILDTAHGQPWFDFKYMNGGNNQGLNRPCIFEQHQPKALFELYCEKTGRSLFP
jgi:hypothetical protein